MCLNLNHPELWIGQALERLKAAQAKHDEAEADTFMWKHIFLHKDKTWCIAGQV